MGGLAGLVSVKCKHQECMEGLEVTKHSLAIPGGGRNLHRRCLLCCPISSSCSLEIRSLQSFAELIAKCGRGRMAPVRHHMQRYWS